MILPALLGTALNNFPAQEVVAGTSLVQGVLRGLTAKNVPVDNLLPPAACPGHYDIKPSQVARLSSCDLLVLQPFQPGSPNISRAVAASGLSGDKVLVVPVPGNWMLPQNQVQATRELARLLGERFPGQRETLEEAAAERVKAIQAWAAAQRARLGAAQEKPVPVLCESIQAPMAKWAGCHVAAEFQRLEDMSAADMARILEQAREGEVRFVISNMQSFGPDFGQTLASELDVPHVVLSNFPGGFDDTPTWERAFAHNAGLLRDAMEAASP